MEYMNVIAVALVFLFDDKTSIKQITYIAYTLSWNA